MALGKVLVTVFATAATLAGAGYLISTFGQPTPNGTGNGNGNGPPKLGSWEFAEWTTTATDPAAELPTIVVLHDTDSGDADIRAMFAGFESPARVLVPLGTVGSGQKRSYIEPQADLMTLQKVSIGLQDFLFAALQERKVKGRLIVVGLGSSGTLATALGLFAGLAVRQAYALGGSYNTSSVPLAPQADVKIRQWLQSVLSKSVQDATTEAFKLMTSRGFNAELLIGDFDLPVTTAVFKAWLWPELLQGVGEA
ncbi:hypothetical protein SAMN02745121_00280 [Nannocystis exedens]|uniref:Uncharacterized protein n=1 Tax=Nannocystis exedens TaxID=54 RepID=A0A1I1SUS0_9BACT|nr:hypothetical protein [Nannocystis exedens]PCC75739.1 hypothetical protein NAEX_08852 [Nannocystis exedens]SFD50091.1 hypothetical protein SAMN02745121_00280 [Nannocystis exedens]